MTERAVGKADQGGVGRMRVNRRKLLTSLTAIPIVGGLIALVSPLFRYLKPNDRPWQIFTVAPDAPRGGAQVIGRTTMLVRPWDSFYFTYRQRYVQYDAAGYKAANIPGVALRLPRRVRFANVQGFVGYSGETDIVLFSRICPHLGCIFNYEPNWHNVTAGYGGFVPPTWERHPLMACPCHFSIYDPEYPGDPGNVISGPAPRGARYFRFEVRGTDIVVTGAEAGGIADAPEPSRLPDG
jgi:arsenite oxidase small subunit